MLPAGWRFPGQYQVNPLTTRLLNRLFHGASDAAGIEKRVSLLTLRHCFAFHPLEQEVEICAIQVQLGHKKLDNRPRHPIRLHDTTRGQGVARDLLAIEFVS